MVFVLKSRHRQGIGGCLIVSELIVKAFGLETLGELGIHFGTPLKQVLYGVI